MTLDPTSEKDPPGSATAPSNGVAQAAVRPPAEAGNREPQVPSMLPSPAPRPVRRLRPRVLVALIVIVVAAGFGGYYWWRQSLDQLPAGIVAGNGRIEADEIDISTKFAGRVATLMVDEGYMVTAGQVVATMDTRDLEASLRRAQAQVQQAQQAIDEASATQTQQRTQVALAQQQLDRTVYLAQRGNATQELLDQRRQQLDGATAALNAATAHVALAEHALDAAQQEAEVYQINIKDNTLVAPRDGRIQYRIANLGEVLPVGGKVFTMIDIMSVYMDVYLPTLEAGRIKIGTDSRIVLDAYPTLAIPAKVSFVATQSQFTPKTVETKTERDRLMFRVRVRIDPDLLRAHADSVRSGLPGVAYVRFDPNAEWPERLQRVPAQ